MAGLKTALTLEEEKRKKIEVKIIEERRQVAKAVEQAILSFKSLEKLKNIKVVFAQEAFVKGFDLCQKKVAKRFLELNFGFLV
ncbi:hypothetical protein COCNU_scaffold010320G000020 [Cocos nucifera]|nr:hypothetical protein [Cocos nucifera]